MCENKTCPKCGSAAFLAGYISFLLSFETADLAAVAAALVLGVGGLQGLSLGFVALCAVLAALPLLITVRRKEFCTRCQIEFIEENTSKVSSPDSIARK